jgi:hypothetical protein
MEVNALNECGYMEINHLPKYQPFLVDYVDMDSAIQVDCSGTGVLDFFDPLNEDLKVEINANINNALKNYGQKTGHNASYIGYNLTFLPTNKIDSKYNTQVIGIELVIVFKKPVKNVSIYALQPSIRLITSIILGEIFILKSRC